MTNHARRSFLWMVVLLAAIGCRASSRWSDTHATQLHVNGFAAPIPDGWRDLHELVEQPAVSLPEGSRTLLIERIGPVGEIDVIPTTPLVAIADNPCERIGEAGNAMGGSNGVKLDGAESATFDGDPGCLMHVTVSGLSGKLAIRSHADHAVVVRCLHGAGADYREVDYACEKVLYGLQLVRP
jgi:hypothetical protein